MIASVDALQEVLKPLHSLTTTFVTHGVNSSSTLSGRFTALQLLKEEIYENEVFATCGNSLDIGPAISTRRVGTRQCTHGRDFFCRANRQHTSETWQLQGRVARNWPCGTGELPAEREDCGHVASNVKRRMSIKSNRTLS